MSSSDHSPYKSRLFTFLNRQSLRWRDRLSKTVQHLRVGVEWGTQILIYPVYLMVQAGRITQQKLGQTFKQVALPSQASDTVTHPLSVDRPLQQVLEKAENCLNDTENTDLEAFVNPKNSVSLKNFINPIKQRIQEACLDPNSLLETIDAQDPDWPVLVQGMASSLDNHHLVFVTEDNATLDILSEAQQKYLNAQIRLESANYWYDLKQTERDQNLKKISAFSSHQVNVIPPIRWFWQTMRWVQTSEVAITLDFFNESSLVRSSPTPSNLSQSSVSHVIQQDDFSSFRETNNDISQTSSTYSGQLAHLIQQAINYFFGDASNPKIGIPSKHYKRLTNGSESLKLPENLPIKLLPSRQTLRKLSQTSPLQSLIKPVQEWGAKLEKKANHSLAEGNSDPFQLQLLIYAAIDYFFGNPIKPALNEGKVSLNNESNYQKIEDPWLSWDDLYEETDSVPINHPNLSSPNSLPQVAEFSQNSGKNSKKRIKHSKPLEKRRPIIKSVTKSPKVNRTVQKSSPNPSTDIDPSFSDWIETEAKPTGYVKHPLERVLNWLDLAIHWVEEWGTKLWQWVRKRF